MNKLTSHLRNYTKESILAPLFKMLEAFLDLLVPLVVAGIINNGIANNDTSLIIRQVMILVLLALISLVCSITAQYFAAKASVGFASSLRQALFDHILSFSYTELDTQGSSTLINRLTTDINQVQNGLNLALRLLLRSPFIVFGAMIMAFTIDVKCALIFLAAIPVLLAVVFGIMLVSIPLFAKVQSAADSLLSTVRENLTGVRVIRAFRKEEDEVEEFGRRNNSLTDMNLFVGRISALMNPLTYTIINIATIILIREGALQVQLGILKQGDVVALYNYMAQIIVELIKLASLIITINRSLACAGRIKDVLETEPSMKYASVSPAASDTENAVVFDHVCFTYAKAGAESLTDISFTAKKGQVTGIIGSTGSGKSSLLNLIPRFYDATSGHVLVNGADVKDWPQQELLSEIGIVPQKAVLFAGTIRDNLKWGRENATDEELMKAAELAQAKEVIEGKEGQLDYELEQNGRNLSGGQRQRLTIARALVRNPSILILDDSASALDFATDAALRKALSTLKDTTVFIVSQRASSIMHADQILVLDDGTLAGTGTHQELLASCRTYQEIYYSQFPEERKEADDVRK